MAIAIGIGSSTIKGSAEIGDGIQCRVAEQLAGEELPEVLGADEAHRHVWVEIPALESEAEGRDQRPIGEEPDEREHRRNIEIGRERASTRARRRNLGAQLPAAGKGDHRPVSAWRSP